MEKVTLKVFGKINLSLNITGISGGFHMLDSVVTSVSVFDLLSVKKRKDSKVNLSFNASFIPQDNTVTKAVSLLQAQFGAFGADITVDKHLPLSGGMGGSSADAAGVIVALSRLYDFDGTKLRNVCSKVGADVYYMLKGGYARLKGIGDEVSPINCNRSMGLVYLCSTGTLTGKVYSMYDSLGGDGMVDNDALINALINGGEPKLGNMLQRAATSLNGEIERNAQALRSIGLKPNMTGSGSTVYAFSENPSLDIQRLKEKGYDAYSARTLQSGIEFI